MSAYLLRRMLLVIPTLWGILTINFFLVQLAPGGPVEQMLARLHGVEVGATAKVAGPAAEGGTAGTGMYRGAQGLDRQLQARIEKLYGFDRPIGERYVETLIHYARFDLGESLFRGKPVMQLIVERLPVSMSLGVWSTLLIYAISIPLGVAKAVRHGSSFDAATSLVVVMGSAIPVFLFAMLLVVLFAGGSFWQIFPLRGLTSPGWEEMTLWGKVVDYFWHLALPVTAMTIGGFATLTMLTKNCFLEELSKLYTVTARAKGASERGVLLGHVFRNAMLLVIAGFPAAFIGMFFTGSLLVEVIFSLDGLGLLGFEATISRDYPVIFGSLYVFTLLGLLTKILSDLTYTLVDPRIHFGGQQ
ncbi:MAG: microcin transport system permease protein [Desulfomicrobiaceae bacterium]|nr:microcin transport system permease protein [Desulfomicrobiaceae bacterium]